MRDLAMQDARRLKDAGARLQHDLANTINIRTAPTPSAHRPSGNPARDNAIRRRRRLPGFARITWAWIFPSVTFFIARSRYSKKPRRPPSNCASRACVTTKSSAGLRLSCRVAHCVSPPESAPLNPRKAGACRRLGKSTRSRRKRLPAPCRRGLGGRRMARRGKWRGHEKPPTPSPAAFRNRARPFPDRDR